MQNRARQQCHIFADFHGDIDKCVLWLEHRHSRHQQRRVGAIAQFAFGHRQLPTIVDATDFVCWRGVRTDLMTHACQNFDRIGQVVLGLRIVVRNSTQRGAEKVASKRINSGVDFVD